MYDNMKKAVVTGGAGFIGSHIVDALIASGYETHVVDNLSNGSRDNVNSSATLHEVDIRDYDALRAIFDGAELVFHLAALPRVQFSIEHPDISHDHNVNGTLNVLRAAKDAGVRRVIYSASSSAYGDQPMPLKEDLPARPKSPYGLQKYVGELMCSLYAEIYKLETVSLRYFNVYGPRMNPLGAYPLVIGYFLKLKKEGKPLTITGDGTQTRDFVNVLDVVRANMLAATSASVGCGEVINIGGGNNVSVNRIAELIGGPTEYIDARLEPHDTLADTTRARKLLGWSTTVSIEDGVREIL